MSYSAIAVANSIIRVAKNKGINDLTPMKIQKLMYFAQFIYLKSHQEIFIDDNFVRWQYGPVIPSLYYQLRSYQSQPINDYIQQLIGNDEVIIYKIPQEDYKSWNFLDSILNEFGKSDAFYLSKLTHSEKSAWERGEINTVITREDMEKSSL